MGCLRYRRVLWCPIMRTLIVDDEYISRRVMLGMVGQHGECEPVASGEEAIMAFCLAHDESRPFDLVLLDIEMPQMDGFETLKRLRTEEQRRRLVGRHAVKVIMTTVRDDPNSVFAAFRDQAEAYLIKPVLLEALNKQLVQLKLIRG
jgi:two-component system chemotaxis response regulator CheY